EVGDVVDLVLVQTDRTHQVHLQLVAGRDAADQVVAGAAGVLGDREDRGDVVPGMGVVGGEELVVVVQLAHGDAVGPRGPFGGGAAGDPGDARAGAAGGDRVAERLGVRGVDGGSVQGRDGDGGVVDDLVDDNLLDIAVDLDRVHGDVGHLPCQLALEGQVLVGAVDADVVVSHDVDSWVVGGGVGWSVPVPVPVPVPVSGRPLPEPWCRKSV